MNNKDLLIQHLISKGKTDSWENLAKQFKLPSGEAARSAWKLFRKRSLNKPKKTKGEGLSSFAENVNDNSAELIFNSHSEIRTLEELITKCNIDTKVWDIERYVQNFWGNSDTPYWQVKAFLTKKKKHVDFQDRFIEFLRGYKPASLPIINKSAHTATSLPKANLLINKQDEHFNKFDVDGKNSVDDRLLNLRIKIQTILDQSILSNHLSKITYIIGSDSFNAEWTNATTKGTPQESLLTYEEAFTKICDNECAIIDMLSSVSNGVDVIFIPGNHDQYVGWHMASWLSTYYRNNKNITFDLDPNPTKCVKYGKVAMMFNHGDVMKPEKLAGIFPQLFREEWSSCNHFYIFIGDKHHEMSKDINGIKFFQLPQLSTSKSRWDSKRGFGIQNAEIHAFIIEEEDGITATYRRII